MLKRPSAWSRRQRSMAAGGVVVLVAGVLSAFALNSTGYAQAQVSLSTSSVWTMKSSDPLVGRVNDQIKQLDSSLAMATGKFDVLQFDDQVLVVDLSKNQIRPVDITSVTLGTQLTFPRNAEVDLGAATISIADPATGKWWLGTVSSLAGLDPASTPPLLTVAPGVSSAVSVTGKAFAVAEGSNKLWSVALGSDGLPVGGVADKSGKPVPPAPTVLPGGVLSSVAAPLASPISISAVGDVPVVLDSAAGSLIIGRNRVSVAAGAVLQHPGPAASSVVLSTPTQLLAYPLAGGAPTVLFGKGGGVPVAPVVVDGCAYAAWNGATLVEALSCQGVHGSQSVMLPSIGKVDPVFRVNRHAVVLNDRTSGTTWSVTRDLHVDTIDNWDQVKPQNQGNISNNNGGSSTQSPNVASPRANCAKQGPQKSVAKPATFTVRAGRATILPVLTFVSAADCAAVRIDAVKGLAASDGSAVVVQDGQAVQVTTAPAAAGSLSMTYTVDDGVNPAVSAALTVSVAPTTQVGAIKRYKQSSAEVEVNGTVSYNVLPDYYSTTGDDLYLSSAQPSTPDETVNFTPGGEITFGDKGLSGTGKHDVHFTVTDGTATYPDTLTVTVLAERTGKLTASSVLASSLVGVQTRSQPLRSVLWPGAGPAQLTGVTANTAAAGVSASVNSDGSVMLEATRTGTYFFTYAVAAGSEKATGVLRFDVARPDPAAPVVATTDVVYLPDGDSVRVDPTANDIDPNGVGLAVQRVGSESSAQLSVTDADMQTLQIAARGTLTAPTAFSYSVSNGSKLATGQVRVVPVPALSDPPPPVANPISLSVRAGDVLSLPVARFASDPRGQVLTPTIVGDPSSLPGVLFATKTAIRYLAPSAAPPSPVKFGYAVTNTSGLTSAGATVTLNVVVLDPGTDAAPNQPAPVIARVLAGKVVTFPLPLDGLDPDGDWVTLTSVSEPSKHLGSVAVAGLSSIAYSASKSGGGVDTITYTASDPYGKSVTGAVTVIVVPAPNQVQPPVAPNLVASVRPGKAVSVRPFDSGVTGENVKFDTPAFDAPPGWVVSRDSDALVISAPGKASGAAAVTYHVVDDRGQTASGVISVTVSLTASLVPPALQDAFVTKAMVTDKTTAMVDVTTDIKNSNGANADLLLGLEPGAAASLASGRVVKVPLTSIRQVVAYTATDGEKQVSTAFVVVPAKSDLVDVPPPVTTKPPTPASLQPIPSAQPTKSSPVTDLPPVPVQNAATLTVHAGQSVTGQIGDYVNVPAGRGARIADGQRLSASQGTGKRNDATSFNYTANPTGSGADTLTIPVSVGNSTTTDIQVPIQIIPNAPQLSDGSLPVEVDATGTLDLTTLVDPNYPGRDSLTYVVTGGATGFRISNSQSTLTVRVGAVPKGTQAVLTVVASEGSNQSSAAHVTVTATGTTKPLPTLTPVPSEIGKPGASTPFTVLAGSTDPFGQGLTIVPGSVKVIQGKAAAAIAGSNISVTPANGQAGVGTILVQFTVGDGAREASRNVTGKVILIVKDKPRIPGVPTAVAGSATASSVTLTWDWQPLYANGGAMQPFLVSSAAGPTNCAQSTCQIKNLTPGQSYTFIVTATNEVGSSRSIPSAAITPDAAPPVPAVPDVTLTGDRQLTVTWAIGRDDKAYSPVTNAELTEVIDGVDSVPSTINTSGSGSKTFSALSIDSQYSFYLTVTNAKDTVSSVRSAPQHPNTTPGPPQAVTLAYDFDAHSLTASWSAPTPSAQRPSPTGYTVTYTKDGGSRTLTATGTSIPIGSPVDGYSYVVTQVVADNTYGAGDPSSPASATVVPFSRPTAVTAIAATATGADHSVVLSGVVGGAPSGRQGQYFYSTDGSSWRGFSSGDTVSVDSAGNTLSNGAAYTFAARYCYPDEAPYTSIQLCGVSATAPATATPYGPVGGPANVRQAGQSQTQIRFDWSPPGDNGRGPITTRYSVDGGGWTAAGQGVVAVVVGNWGCGTSHSINVQAFDSQGLAGPASGNVGGSTAACPPPPPPSVTAVQGDVYTGTQNCTFTIPCHHLKFTVHNWSGTTTVECRNNTGTFSSHVFSIADGVQIQTFCFMGPDSHNPTYGLPYVRVDGVADSNRVSPW